MADTRKNIKAVPNVKAELQAILNEIAPGKTESFVLAYLTAMFQDQKAKRIKLSDHQAYMKIAEEMNNQGSI
ncbi:hypothetical protein CDO73_26150 [Saccharibacillus sp. O23]|uniref:hypothetical protein n=1 Tax=Saccharibacillus sp. O23 TaxID=2009338 RepID=UPI000B41B9C8|nr:hypothetical protein [Saccharibacillus sp. O23]OWA33031.1 hypothetical protein B9G55_23830 [Saccharibacillus sp. O16]OWR25664.1 hypothetical protein CDO73_26150 [Saccharibacillus sp. O23]